MTKDFSHIPTVRARMRRASAGAGAWQRPRRDLGAKRVQADIGCHPGDGKGWPIGPKPRSPDIMPGAALVKCRGLGAVNGQNPAI
jgi:hypothetical protein